MEGNHYDKDKIEIHYIFELSLIDEMAKVGTFGTKKYGRYNYRNGISYMRILGSCTRHLTAFIRGENNDKESGLSHLAHLAYDAAMLFDIIRLHPDYDDRPRGC